VEVEREDPALGERVAEELTPTLHRALRPIVSCGADTLERAFRRCLVLFDLKSAEDEFADLVAVGAAQLHPPLVGIQLFPPEWVDELAWAVWAAVHGEDRTAPIMGLLSDVVDPV
jgi:hypothetical protein